MARITWNGDEVRRKVGVAVALGIDATMAEAVKVAKADHRPYPPASAPHERYAKRTGENEASIGIKRETTPDAPGHLSGAWGADMDYSLYVEVGTSRLHPGGPRAEERVAAAGGNMWDVPPPSNPPLMVARETLRPAADIAYEGLPRRIAEAFQGEG